MQSVSVSSDVINFIHFINACIMGHMGLIYIIYDIGFETIKCFHHIYYYLKVIYATSIFQSNGILLTKRGTCTFYTREIPSTFFISKMKNICSALYQNIEGNGGCNLENLHSILIWKILGKNISGRCQPICSRRLSVSVNIV